MNKYYITTAIPYVNGKPHIGHTLEYFQADAVRRYHQLLGQETLLLSGADENALKNVQAAEKEGLPVQEYLDKYSRIWQDIYEFVGVHLDVFQRGSDQKKHWPGVQKLWKLCADAGDIYKKAYKGLYCVGCEAFITEKELVAGLCPTHQKPPESVSEENYFFRLSKYQGKLLNLIENNALKITPENKRAETLSFIRSSLEDFSISRSRERAKGVGVPVLDDPDQLVYVWFDALDIYMTGVGFGWNEDTWRKWWPADLHIIGKDINRFHTVYWPAILLSANLPLPSEILIHSFVQIDSQKISKSIGNVIDPHEVVNQFGLEPVRYYLLSQIPIDEDGNFTAERLKEVYTADLANGLGNLVARVAKLCEINNIEASEYIEGFDPEMVKHLEQFKFSEAIAHIWKEISETDKKINQTRPWELSDDKIKSVLGDLVKRIQAIAYNLQPFLPQTAEKILKQFSGSVKSAPPLFPRI